MSKKLLIVGAIIFIFVSFFVDYILLTYPKNVAPIPLTILKTENLPVPQPVRALFVGDIMLDRAVAKHATQYGAASLFANVRSLFEGNDMIVGNLEGTITSNPSVSQNNSGILRFTFTPELARDVLTALNFSAVNLANNHTLDFGSAGYADTKENLTKNAVLFFGSPSNSENLSTQKEVNGKLFCFVGYEEFINSDPQPILDEIQSLRVPCYQIIVFTHWGIEYSPVPTDEQKTLAHSFVDAGADVVIGSHPHVVQPFEIYKNKAIFYSLGNFMFDQNFSYETTQGLAVQIEIADTETHFTLVPITILHSEASFASTTDNASDFSLSR